MVFSDDIAAKDKILINAAELLDISPTMYEKAVARYKAVGKWLEEIELEHIFIDSKEQAPSSAELAIFPQGSFALGTVVKPWVNGAEKEYDIDLVCHIKIPVGDKSPMHLKQAVGKRLKDHGAYQKMLQPEGKRCWTIDYAEAGTIEFHMDILPALDGKSSIINNALSITHRHNNNQYEWLGSNPANYAAWFKERNRAAFDRVQAFSRAKIRNANESLYASVADVPDFLIKTPLQRVIQILKRHRDICFSGKNNEDAKPISMILTTLAAHAYGGENNTYEALRSIISTLENYRVFLEGKTLAAHVLHRDLIQRTPDGRWRILNPVCPEENFADRWHEDNHKKAKAFFQWVEDVKQDMDMLLEAGDREEEQKTMQKIFGARVATNAFPPSITGFPTIVIHGGDSKEYPVDDTPRPWRENDFN